MKLTEEIIKELTLLASKAAIDAGEIIQSMANNHLRLEDKTGGSSIASQVLTEADLKAQHLIYEALKPSMLQFDLGWLGEESPDDHSRLIKDYFWCVDPLDGTLPFTEGYPGYGVSIGLINKQGKAVIGVIYLPFEERIVNSMQELKVGSKNDHKLHFFCDRSFLRHPYFDQIMECMNEYVKLNELESIEMHTHAGAVVNAISVMDNSNSCYFKSPKAKKGGGSIWDYAATNAILKKAGAIVSDMFGEEMDLNNAGTSFMNDKGILYASDSRFADYIIQKHKEIVMNNQIK